MLTELQWYRLSDLIAGLPQIEWFVYQVELTGDFLYVSSRSIQDRDRTILFIVNAQGDLR